MQATFELDYYLTGDCHQPLILFLHGFMGNKHEFDLAVGMLGNKFSYLTVDLPGHGTQVFNSDKCYEMENTAQALISLLDELKIKRCFLVGYSMGGRLALYLNLNFPQYFSKVILESANPGLLTDIERLERTNRDEQIARKLERSDFTAFLNNWYKQPIFGSMHQHPKFTQLIENRLQNNPKELAKSLRFMGTGRQPSLWQKLKENNNPLLLLVGENDDKFVDVNKKIFNLCPLTLLQIISNCSHNIHFEQTIIFVTSVQKFFGSVR